MPNKNDNGEKRWLTWLVRIILPALIAAQWLGLAGEIDDLRNEVRRLRDEVRGELSAQEDRCREQGEHLTRLDTVVELLWDDGRGK